MDTESESANETIENYQDAAWVSGIFRPLLICLLATSVAAAPLAIMRSVTDWRLGYMLPLIFLTTIEGVYSTQQRGRPQWRDRRGLIIRLAEVVSLLVVLRLASWLFSLGLPGLAEFALWLRDPGAFFDAQFIIVGLTLLFCWFLSIGMTSDFLELALQADEFAEHEAQAWDDSRSYQRAARAKSRLDTVSQFAWRWGWGGIVIVVLAAMSRVRVTFDIKGISRLGILGANLPPDVLGAMVCYFLSGFILLSEGRLAVLRGRWYTQRITVMPGVLNRWRLGSILMVLAVAAMAALLPLGSTGWLATPLGFLIAIVFRIVQALMAVLLFLLSLILFPLRFLFSSDQQQQAPPQAPQLQLPTTPITASHLPPWLGGAVYWTLIVAILLYLLFTYLNAHGLLKAGWRMRWLHLRLWWRARWARISAPARQALSTLRQRLRPRRPALQAPRLAVRLGNLPPAARIRYFYLRTLDQAAARGMARPPHKTPLEFSKDFTGQWPDSEVDFKELTEAFLAARYDRRTIPAEKARDVQSVWRRVMRTLHKPKGESQARD